MARRSPIPDAHARPTRSRRVNPERLRASIAAIGGRRTLDAANIVTHLVATGRHFEVRAGAVAQAEAYARATIARLAAAGLIQAPGARFDLTEVANHLALAEAGRGPPAVPPCGVETGRRLVATLAGAAGTARAPDLTALPPRRFEVSFVRTFDLADAAPDGPPRLRLPLPVADGELDALAIVTDAVARRLAGRIEARPAPGDGPQVTLGARFSFVARPGGAPAPEDGANGAEDRALWLAEAEGAIRVTPRVRALAARLAGGTADPLAAIGAFRDHLLDALACGIVHYDRIGAAPATDWVLDHGWYDCRLGAALLAALCRARGIPARLVGGYLLWDAPAEHYWMEAWVAGRGWLPFDLMAWGLSAGGRDAGWRGVYAGAIDYRMKTQIFPRIVTGAPGAALRGPVFRLTRPIDGGAESRFVSAEDGRLVHADAIRIVSGGIGTGETVAGGTVAG